MNYKPLDIPNFELISNKVFDYVQTNTDILLGDAFWNWTNAQQVLTLIPELRTTLDRLNLVVDQISIIKTKPRSNLRVHIDYDKEPRILWPIRNCQGSYTKFFDVDPSNILEQRGIKNDIYYLILDPEKATLIDTLELTQPVMFKPWIAHGVWTNPECDEPRLTMTIKFKNDTSHVFSKD